MTAFFIAPFILWVAIGMWIYFDAAERGKPAVAWSLSFLLLFWLAAVPLILYVIFRDTGQKRALAEGAAKRQYLYVASLSGLVTTTLGFSLVISGGITEAAPGDSLSGDELRELLASGIAGVLVGLVLWIAHWYLTIVHINHIDNDGRFRATFESYRLYIITVFGFCGIVVLIFSMGLIGGGLANAFGTKDLDPGDWIFTVGPILVALAMAILHLWVYYRYPGYAALQRRYEQIEVTEPSVPTAGGSEAPVSPPSPSPEAGATTPHRYCTQCGTSVSPGHKFCGACGTELQAK